jgi:hypothetical protein
MMMMVMVLVMAMMIMMMMGIINFFPAHGHDLLVSDDISFPPSHLRLEGCHHQPHLFG